MTEGTEGDPERNAGVGTEWPCRFFKEFKRYPWGNGKVSVDF